MTEGGGGAWPFLALLAVPFCCGALAWVGAAGLAATGGISFGQGLLWLGIPLIAVSVLVGVWSLRQRRSVHEP